MAEAIQRLQPKPQLDNFTKFYADFIEFKLTQELSPIENKLMDYLYRRIYGWKVIKECEFISISQLQKGAISKETGEVLNYGTGMSIASIYNALETLLCPYKTYPGSPGRPRVQEVQEGKKSKELIIKNMTSTFKQNREKGNCYHINFKKYRHNFKEDRFIPINNKLIDEVMPNLLATEWQIYIYLKYVQCSNFFQWKEEINLSMSKIGKALGLSVRTVKTVVRQLEFYGLIKGYSVIEFQNSMLEVVQKHITIANKLKRSTRIEVKIEDQNSVRQNFIDGGGISVFCTTPISEICTNKGGGISEICTDKVEMVQKTETLLDPKETKKETISLDTSLPGSPVLLPKIDTMELPGLLAMIEESEQKLTPTELKFRAQVETRIENQEKRSTFKNEVHLNPDRIKLSMLSMFEDEDLKEPIYKHKEKKNRSEVITG